MIALFAGYSLFGWHTQARTLNWQQNCFDQLVKDAKTLIHEQLDVNQDGVQDDVMIYGNDDLYLLVTIDHSSQGCTIILNEYLTVLQLDSGGRVPLIQNIALVELTGDDNPELYISLRIEGDTPRLSRAFDIVYMRREGGLRRILLLDQCLAFSSFEFRSAANGARVIYRDSDTKCVTPFSDQRYYEILKWNEDRFEVVGSGTVTKYSLYPPVWYIICLGASLLVITLSMVPIFRRLRKTCAA